VGRAAAAVSKEIGPRSGVLKVDMNTGTSAKDKDRYSQKAPGVYLEEKFSEPRRDVFSTGVPVFIGLFRSAPGESKPVSRVLSLWSHFAWLIGKPYQNCTLGYAVRGFFQNGGTQCHVIVLEDLQLHSVQDALDLAATFHTVDLVCVPDLGEQRSAALELQQLVVNHCEDVGNRFAILDSWRDAKPADVCQQWSDIDGKNGAIYYPWIEVGGFDHGTILVPPCGHVAGVYARTDKSRGVHKAPANEVLEGVVKLERHLTNADQDALNPNRINCLRSFPGRGIRVWGARTLSGHDAWTYVNVRRLFLTAVRWIEWHMGDVVFEPNDAKLWARIDSELQRYFLDLYRQGALQGRTPAEAYYVKCNAETNPREVIDSGRVVAEIGLAPTTPFEFVIVRLIYGASGVSIKGPARPEQNL
jgi:uncharacterized protein